jgi:hypothetical protein
MTIVARIVPKGDPREKASVTMGRRIRKRCLGAAVFAAAGIGVTIAVAWGTALVMGGNHEGILWLDNHHFDTHSVTIAGAAGRWTTLVQWNVHIEWHRRDLYKQNDRVAIPSWSRVRERPVADEWANKGGDVTKRGEVAFGVPWRSMAVEYVDRKTAAGSARTLVWGLNVRGGAGPTPTVLPTRILWAGFGGNALLAALVLGGVTTGTQALLRRRRHAKGRCQDCGYDLRGAVGVMCPECGGKIGNGVNG